MSKGELAMGRWDKLMKRLIGTKPHHFISWLFPDAQLISIHNHELKTESLFADALIEVEIEGERCLRWQRRLVDWSLKRTLNKSGFAGGLRCFRIF